MTTTRVSDIKLIHLVLASEMAVLSAIYLSVFTPLGQPETVQVEDRELQEFTENFSHDLEEGYCLFGKIENQTAHVEDVIHAENPFVQKEDRIKFSCVPEILSKTPEVFTGKTDFIGAVHTHPQTYTTHLSLVDREFLQYSYPFHDIHGISNGTHVAFHETHSIEDLNTIQHSEVLP